MLTFLVLAFWRTWTVELLPGQFGCKVSCGLGTNQLGGVFDMWSHKRAI